MVRPKTIAKSLKKTLKDSSEVPNEFSYTVKQLDEQSNKKLPVISIETLNKINLTRSNTDYVKDRVDDNGNHTGKIYASDYDVSFQIDVYTVEDSKFDGHSIGQRIEDSVLYKHSMYSLQKPFLDEDGNEINQIWSFSIDDSSAEDDLTKTANLRRWRIDVSFNAYHRFVEDVDYIEEVTYEQKVL